MASSLVVEKATEDEETWLFGPQETTMVTETTEPNMSREVISGSKLSVDAAVFEPKRNQDIPDVISDNVIDEINIERNHAGDADTVEPEDNEDEDDEDDSDDDIKVTIGDIKTQVFDPSAVGFKPPYQRQGSGVGGAKQAGKGLDIESIGSINGVPVYEFDIDSLKMEEKPWRKPGADITDYFNYGFNEDTWTKYCERQRRLKMETSNPTKSGNLIFVHGSDGPPPARRPDQRHLMDVINSGPSSENIYNNLASQRRNGPTPENKMAAGTINVIGTTMSRRMYPTRDFPEHEPMDDSRDFQPISSVMTMMPIQQLSLPPPHLGIPPPDFALPPPHLVPPPQSGCMPFLPPHQVIIQTPVSVGLAPNFPPPSMSGPPPQFFIQRGPPPAEHHPPPGFLNRPPFGFDPTPHAPQYAAPPNLPPPGWETRPLDSYTGTAVVGSAAPWDFPGSPTRSDTDFSSSDDDSEQRQISSRIKEPLDRQFHNFARSRSRERARELDRSRSSRDREQDREQDRERERRSLREREDERNRTKRSDDSRSHASGAKQGTSRPTNIKQEPHDENNTMNKS